MVEQIGLLLGGHHPRIIITGPREIKTGRMGSSLLSVDGSAIALMGFAHDDARFGVGEAINELNSHGVRVEILVEMNRTV